MAVISTQTHPKLLWPGLYQTFHDGMTKEWPELYTKAFDIHSSTQHYEEIQGVTSFGMAPQKTQGAALIYDKEEQGYNKRFTHITYAIGTQVTKEENADNLYTKVGGSRVRMLSKSMRETVEVTSWNHFNRATDANYTGWDSKALLATDHPYVNGGTWQNEPTTGTDLSELAVEDLIILMMQAENDRGIKEMLKPRCLFVHPNNWFNAQRILTSVKQNDTDLNATNVLKDGNWFPDGAVVVPYMDNSDDWFIKTDAEQGLYFFWRQRPEMEKDVDFQTKNLLFSGDMRFSSGWVNPKAVYGSPGA